MSTPDAATVRRKLFEALGGTVTRGPWDDVMHGYAWQAAWPGGEDLEWLPAETADEYWQQLAHSLTTAVPNWPVDDGEALALCLDILDRLNATSSGKMWQLEFTDCYVTLNQMAYGGGCYGGYSADTRDALGMAQIALEALERLAAQP